MCCLGKACIFKKNLIVFLEAADSQKMKKEIYLYTVMQEKKVCKRINTGSPDNNLSNACKREHTTQTLHFLMAHSLLCFSVTVQMKSSATKH